MPINTDVVSLVADFIEPNPVVYTRLATVNKIFLEVFTSDRLWRRLDAYNTQTAIFTDFIQHLPTFERIMCACWLPIPSNGQFDPEMVDNHYVKLGWYLGCISSNSFPLSVKLEYPWLTELLGNLSKKPIQLLDSEADDEQKVWDLCIKYSEKIRYASDRIKGSHDFMCRFIDATKRMNLGLGFIGLHWDPRIIAHAIRVNPAALNQFNLPLNVIAQQFRFGRLEDIGPARFKELLTTRQAVLESIRGNPRYLDYFPEYWDDHEICMAAVEPSGKLIGSVVEFETNWEFLKNCSDDAVIERAIMYYPFSIPHIPAKYRKDPKVVKHGLANSIGAWYPDCFEPEPFRDVEVLEVWMDLGCGNFDEYPSPATLSRMCGRLDWMKERVMVRPSSWHFASKKLKNNKELLRAALKAQRMLEFQEPPGSVDQVYLTLETVPKVLQQDRQLLKEILDTCGITSMPFITPAMVRRYVASGGMIPEDKVTYEMVRVAVLQDVSQISFCQKCLPRLVKDPVMADFVEKYKYDIDWHGKSRWFASNWVRPDWDQVDRDSALRLFKLYPGELEQVHDRWMDIDFVIEAVRSNGYIFGYLRKEFQDNKQVQMAIGPFTENLKP